MAWIIGAGNVDLVSPGDALWRVVAEATERQTDSPPKSAISRSPRRIPRKPENNRSGVDSHSQSFQTRRWPPVRRRMQNRNVSC